MTSTDDFRPLLNPQTADPALAALYEVSDGFLRRAARRWLTRDIRQRADSQDVAQAVWMGLLRGGVSADQFQGAEQVRAFLVKAVRNQVVDQARRHQVASAAEAHDRSGGPAERVADGRPRPSQEAAAVDLWERMNALCPPEHRPILELRREGLTLDEVAARVGLHEGSIRRVLARKVAFHGLEGFP